MDRQDILGLNVLDRLQEDQVHRSKLIGREERCVLIDGTVRRTPVAEIFIDTPYFTGMTTAVCMKNPLYDLIIGNIIGAADPSTTTSPLPASAVQTRSQLKATKGQSELVTPIADLGSEDVASLQTEDPSLEKAMAAAKDRNDYQFQIQKGFLYRTKSNKQGQTVKQLALPSSLRQRVMTLAHAGVMSGHQGVSRTTERIVKSFWWPGMTKRHQPFLPIL